MARISFSKTKKCGRHGGEGPARARYTYRSGGTGGWGSGPAPAWLRNSCLAARWRATVAGAGRGKQPSEGPRRWQVPSAIGA